MNPNLRTLPIIFGLLALLLAACDNTGEDPINHNPIPPLPDQILFQSNSTLLEVQSGQTLDTVSLRIDLDQDGKNDIYIKLSSFVALCSHQLRQGYDAWIEAFPNSKVQFPYLFNSSPISALYGVSQGDTIYNDRTYYQVNQSSVPLHFNFCGNGNYYSMYGGGYVPFWILRNRPGNLGYLYVHVLGEVITNTNDTVFQIQVGDWALNQTPGNDIIAGQTM